MFPSYSNCTDWQKSTSTDYLDLIGKNVWNLAALLHIMCVLESLKLCTILPSLSTNVFAFLICGLPCKCIWLNMGEVWVTLTLIFQKLFFLPWQCTVIFIRDHDDFSRDYGPIRPHGDFGCWDGCILFMCDGYEMRKII